MNHSSITPTRHCGCCKQYLPVEAFYINKRTQRVDNYCKECRKKTSRKQHEISKSTQCVKSERKYPVITLTKDDGQRKKLILHSLQMVAESIQRKQKRRWREEDERDEDNNL